VIVRAGHGQVNLDYQPPQDRVNRSKPETVLIIVIVLAILAAPLVGMLALWVLPRLFE
jgi:hypothetical protein